MKLSKIKTGIATLAAVATFFGYSMLARAEDKKQTQFESTGVQVEMTSRHGSDSNVTSIKEDLDLKLKKNDVTISVTGSHTDYFGKTEGKKVSGNSDSVKVEAGKKINQNLYLVEYAEIKDDVDPIREFEKKNIASFGIGVNGEYVIKKPVTLIGDVKGSALTNGNKEYSTSLGLRYYINDKDWIDVKCVDWRESIRDTSTAMGYVSGNHKFSEKISGKAYVGVGKEYGKGDKTVSEVGAKVSYKLSKKVKVDVGYSHSNSKTKNNIVGIGVTWRF